MSLPSQSARGGGRNAAVSTRRRRKSPFRSALPFLIVAVLVVIVWFAMRPTGPRTDEPGAPEIPATAGENAARPMEIAQGGGTAPPRTLPGSQEPARDEVERALGHDSAARTPNLAGATPPANAGTPGSANPPAGGVLTQALDGQNPANPTPVTIQTPTQGSDDALSRVRLQIDTARRLAAENDRVGARALLSRVLREPRLSRAEANLLRDELSAINAQLVFGRVVEPGDPLVEEYKVAAGDSLSRIASRRELATHWKLIQRVNGLSDPTKIRLGQTLKLVRGPFHAIVDKSDFRMDIWHGPPSDPTRWIYIRSFDVGLGEADGTPVGTFVISANKLENPGWVNPRDGQERYAPNDPKNPIGEFWLGLDGVGTSQGVTGYGIHGTIDPSSVGRNLSMGCVRLRDEDIAVVYELLAEQVSVVDIVP